jgi:hypothetical protein
MRVAWLNNSEFHTQFHPKKLNDWREGRTLILVKQIKPSAIAQVAWQCRLRSGGTVTANCVQARAKMRRVNNSLPGEAPQSAAHRA